MGLGFGGSSMTGGLMGLNPQQLQGISQALMGFGQGLAGGQGWGQGVAMGLGGANQGIQQARAYATEEEARKARQRLMDLETQKYQGEVDQATAESAAAAKLPKPEGVDAQTWDALPASEKIKTSAGIIQAQVKPPSDSEFGLWRQNYKATHGGVEPDMSAINQYRQSGSSSVSVNMPPLEGQYQKTLGEEEGKQASDVLKAGQQASSVLDTVGALQQARTALQQAGGDVGKLAPVQAQATALMQSLNLNPEALGLPKDAGPAQTIQALTNKLALGNIGAQSGGLPANNFSEADRQFITQMEAGLGDNPSAFDAKLLMRQKVAERNTQAAQMFQSYPQTQDGYHKFQQDWASYIKAHPLFSPQDQTQLFTTAAALKSGADMQAVPQATASAGATEVPSDLLAKPADQWTADDIARAQKALGQ